MIHHTSQTDPEEPSSVSEEILNSITHGIGLSVIGGIALVASCCCASLQVGVC